MSRPPRPRRSTSRAGTRMVRVARALAREVDALSFAEPVTHVYNPLVYARAAQETYLHRYTHTGVRVLMLGMNPGPWGMAQTGVPFGEVSSVRDWLDIDVPVDHPPVEHPKRPIQGPDCPRSEVSGKRLWDWARERWGTADAFSREVFVWNFCPLVFMEASARNRTPDKLPAEERAPLYAACDRALAAVVRAVQPQGLLGVGRFATDRLTQCAQGALADGRPVGTILHPSPASPLANRGWAPQATAQYDAFMARLPAWPGG